MASQLMDISKRFPAHVPDIRDFLLKEQLPVPSPDAIPQLCDRLKTDAGFRADLGSLMRAILYEEREGIGYEDLLGILVAAVAGTENDLKSDSQEADFRELLRFLLQSRRSTFPADAEAASVPVEPAPRESVPVGRVEVDPDPVLWTRGVRPAAASMKLELKHTESPVAVADAESHEVDDFVLPFRSTGLFAAQAELDRPWWGHPSARTVGVVCMLLGLCLGLMIHHVASSAQIGGGVHAADIGPMIHRVVSGVESHLGVRAADSSSSKPEKVGSVAPKESVAENSNAPMLQEHGAVSSSPSNGDAGARKTEAAVGSAQIASVEKSSGAVALPAASDEARSTAQAAAPGTSSRMPVTVVKQVVTAFPSQSLDPGDPMAAAAETKSTVQKASEGVSPANVIFSPPPKYPAEATAARVQGEVTVQAVVDPKGKVIHTQVVSGPTLLRDAAEEAVQRWRYRPLLYNGKPTAVTTVAIVDFKFAE